MYNFSTRNFGIADASLVNLGAQLLLSAIPRADYDMEWGVCSNIVAKLREVGHNEEAISEETVQEILTACFETWFYWNGDYLYPVGGVEEYESNRKWFGESLQKRLSLIHHIIKTTEI